MANEAYVRISEVLKDAPALASAATEFVVAGAIKSKYGDFEPTLIRSRKELLSKYVCDGKLTGLCDVSLINAYEVLGSAPILVCRAASKEYDPVILKDDSDSNVGMQFELEFTDFMFDPNNYGVRVYMSPSQSYPGAVDLNVKYVKVPDMPIYPYSLSESSAEGVTYEGPKLEVGSELILFSESGDEQITVRVKNIFDRGGDTYNVIFELLTTAGYQDSETEFEDAEYGIKVTLDIGKEIETVVKEFNVLFALDESVTDDKGNSLYYENVWDDSYPFKINITGTPEMVTVPNPYKAKDPTQPDTLTYLWYGPNGEPSWVLDSTVVYEPPTPMTLNYDSNTQPLEDEVNDSYGVHWEKLHAYEDRNIPLFTDFGVPYVGSQLKSLANQFSGIYCISLPRLSESVTGARGWDDLDLGNSRRYACTPFALTTNLGFLAQIAPTTQYIKTICTNAIAGREFEAVAGRVTGIAAYSRLTKKYNKYEREELLDLKINTITYKEVDGYAMFNDDLTGLVQNNPFKEEFNRRLGVRISQDVNTLMKQFLFQLNTKSLRDTVESTLNAYFNTAPFNSKIYAFEVKCDDENNPPSLQAQNKLAVTVNIAFYYTAKYIEVVNNIYSVGQSFTE